MLDLIGALVGMSAIAINLTVFTQALANTLARRLTLAAIAGGWVGLASELGATGKLAFSPDSPLPLVAVLFAVPLLVVAALAFGSRRVRNALLAVPILLLAASGRLSGPFPYSAGLGDIITGALAIPLALRVWRSAELPATAVRSWNMFGALDLFAAMTLGVTSAAGSPLQLIHAGVGSGAMQHLPYCLVPTVLVPFYLITHGIVAAQLAVARSARRLSQTPSLIAKPLG
jgi:hypothetical protein